METFLKSKFKVGNKINESPFSLTYQGTTLSGNQSVIIKIYKRGTLSSGLIKEMKQKVKSLQEISSPGIAKLFDGDYGWQGFYYVREFVNFPSLEEIMKERKFEVEEAERIILKACEALKPAHEAQILHGAIKPSNIFLNQQTFAVKLTDFIIEGKIRESLPQKAQVLLNSMAYISPEEILGESATALSDIYNLGQIFYMLVAESKLDLEYFSTLNKTKTFPNFPPTLPRHVQEIITKMIHPDPLLRIKSIGEIEESIINRSLTERKETDWPQIELENMPRAEEKEVKMMKTERKKSFFLLIVILIATIAGIIYSLINSLYMAQ